MLTSIRFNDQPMSCARKVDDEVADGVLSAESIATQATVAERRP
jgi:hypothetical protein